MSPIDGCSGAICFNPEVNPLFQNLNFDLDESPPYLFRTFDSRSTGYTDDNVVISPAAVFRLPHHNQDIFSLEPEFAVALIEKHLDPWRGKNKPPEPGLNPDNLMSWTTSLLYAIQYAYYRRRVYGCKEDQIKIIAVKTSLFPPRTFIRASALLEAHFRLVKQEARQNTMSPHLLRYIFTFGEFLSQGTLVHSHHYGDLNYPTSYVISLAMLRQDGLPMLYPELDDPRGHAKWALTTIALRKKWHGDESGNVDQWQSTLGELQTAANLAVKWFKPPFDPLQLAIYLLSFKRRELDPNQMVCEREMVVLQEAWMRHPVDVRQFVIASTVIENANHARRVSSSSAFHETDSKRDTLISEDFFTELVVQALLYSYIV